MNLNMEFNMDLKIGLRELVTQGGGTIGDSRQTFDNLFIISFIIFKCIMDEHCNKSSEVDALKILETSKSTDFVQTWGLLCIHFNVHAGKALALNLVVLGISTYQN